MKQINTPILAFLFLLIAVFPMDAAIAKTNMGQAKTTINKELIQNDESTTNNRQDVAVSAPRSIPKIEIIQPLETIALSQNMDAAVASQLIPVISESFQDGFWQGIFYGVVILLIIINLISFLLFDEKIYLVFGSSLVALAAFLFFSDGLLAMFDMQNLQNIEIVKASFFLVTAIAGAIFGSYFLNINTLFPKLKFIATGIFSAAAIILMSGWFLNTEVLAVVSNVLATSVLLAYLFTGVLLFSQKNYAKLYVIAMAFPVLFMMDYLLASPFNISFLNIELIHLKGAVLVQILMLTYGILYRMREIKEENLIKQTELKIFLKRQEMTAREKTEKHIEDVYLENVIMQYDLDGFEVKLLQFISEGKSNEKIARKLKLTESDLEEATNELYQKLEIREHIKEDFNLLESQPDFIYN